jgi:hypothetical protein
MNGNASKSQQESWVRFGLWLRQLGISDVTGFRWTRAGLIRPFCVRGRLYLTREQITEFHQKAIAGEFAKQRPVRERVSRRFPSERGA